MSLTYSKLFSSITESTIWGEPHGTRIAWVAMLAMADRKGRVFASIPGFARRAAITLEEAEAALRTFLAPDPYSRTKEHEGRRISEIDGGWQLLNYAKYRAIRDEETIRESKAEHMRRKRAATDPEPQESGTENSTVERGGPKQKQSQKQEKKKSPGGSATPITLATMLAIRDLYNQIMVNLTQCRTLGPERETLIRRCWLRSPEWQSLDFWRAYFEECQDDAFLNGTGPYGKGHENWRPDFNYLLRPATVTKVYERAMDRLEKVNG